MPLVPLPVMTNDPPAEKVPPICRLPLLREPVEKLTLPRVPVTRPNPSRPLTAIKVESPTLSPALVPVSVPLLFVKSTELLANAASGNANVTKSNHNVHFILLPPVCLSLPPCRPLSGSAKRKQAQRSTLSEHGATR